MTEYNFSGTLQQGKKETTFNRTVKGSSLKHARENLYAELGSEHSVVRGKISIESEEEA